MASEAKKKHSQVYNTCNGINQTATRDSKAILAAVGGNAIDESKPVPLLDMSSFEMTEMHVRHVLDFVFYKEGGREHPKGTSFGDGIFDTAAAQTQNNLPQTLRDTEVDLSDGLSDSEDEEAGPPARAPPIGSRRQSATKRRGLEATEPAAAAHRTPAASIFAETSLLERDVDQLVSLQRSARSVEVAGIRDDQATDTQQFEPTRMQSTINLALINVTYAQMTAQRFVEFVQIYWRKFGFFPHPAVLRALFGWDIGTRGLSILHFVRVTEQEKRVRVRSNVMSNFSKKKTLPATTTPADFAEISGAVDVLCAVAQQLYKPVVHDTLMAASRVLGELRVTDLPTSPEALVELAAWVDDLLELFRVFISEENWLGLGQIKDQFSASHESFIRVHQLILRQDVIAASKAACATSNRQSNQPRGERGHDSKKRTNIPAEVRQALPKQGKKEICVRFLSAQGCRGENGNCVIKNLCHFNPATSPDIVREFVTKNYGGVATDFE